MQRQQAFHTSDNTPKFTLIFCNHSVGALVASPRLHKARARLHEAMPLPAGTAQSGLASLVVSMTSSYSMLDIQLQVQMNVQMGEDTQQG